MSSEEQSPDERNAANRLSSVLQSELRRTNVILREATGRMHQVSAPILEYLDGDDDTWVHFSMDVSMDIDGIIETLRQLPDGAGTEAFIDAYNRSHRDWRDGDQTEP